MKALMTSQVGIFRKESDLLAAREKMNELKERLKRVGIKQKGPRLQSRTCELSGTGRDAPSGRNGR